MKEPSGATDDSICTVDGIAYTPGAITEEGIEGKRIASTRWWLVGQLTIANHLESVPNSGTANGNIEQNGSHEEDLPVGVNFNAKCGVIVGDNTVVAIQIIRQLIRQLAHDEGLGDGKGRMTEGKTELGHTRKDVQLSVNDGKGMDAVPFVFGLSMRAEGILEGPATVTMHTVVIMTIDRCSITQTVTDGQ